MAQTSIPDIGGLQPGLPGGLYDMSDSVVDTFVNAEATLSIPPGVMVCKGTNDYDAKLPAASNAVMLGIVLATHAIPIDFGSFVEGMDSTGFKPGVALNILRRGRCYVLVEQDVVQTDRAYVRYAASIVSPATESQLGAFRKDADNDGTSNHAVSVLGQVEYLASALAGKLAPVMVDMNNVA